MDMLKIRVRTGQMEFAHNFNIRQDMSSGPTALSGSGDNDLILLNTNSLDIIILYRYAKILKDLLIFSVTYGLFCLHYFRTHCKYTIQTTNTANCSFQKTGHEPSNKRQSLMITNIILTVILYILLSVIISFTVETR